MGWLWRGEAPRLLFQQPHVHRPGEMRAVGAAMRVEGGLHRESQGLGDLVIGEAGVEHALLEGLPVGEMRGHVEAALGGLLPLPG